MQLAVHASFSDTNSAVVDKQVAPTREIIQPHTADLFFLASEFTLAVNLYILSGLCMLVPVNQLLHLTAQRLSYSIKSGLCYALHVLLLSPINCHVMHAVHRRELDVTSGNIVLLKCHFMKRP